MKINTSLPVFKRKHLDKKNQIIFYKASCKNNSIIENIINNFLIRKNSFIFESVEKRKIRGRYTIIGADPDKIWEFNKKKIYITENNKKRTIKSSPYTFLKKLIENFNSDQRQKMTSVDSKWNYATVAFWLWAILYKTNGCINCLRFLVAV